MEKEQSRGSFDGAAWFERQVQKRTRDELTGRGSTASTHSREYKLEYARQLKLFRAERAEIKKRRKEKYLARMEKKMGSVRPAV